MDVTEIDAASNRRIDDIRELRENVRYRPVRDRYKVFIIDEAHQITSDAFNALLKTLEEPPEWVVFILCTTEPQQFPATIVSRCQSFPFRTVELDLVVEHLKWLCGQEGVEAEDDALSCDRAGRGRQYSRFAVDSRPSDREFWQETRSGGGARFAGSDPGRNHGSHNSCAQGE